MDFPHTITRRRQEPGGTTDVTFAANVAAIELDYSLPEGCLPLVERWLCIVPKPDVLRAAVDGAEKDTVIVFGTVFLVEESRNSPPGHTRAVLFREF